MGNGKKSCNLYNVHYNAHASYHFSPFVYSLEHGERGCLLFHFGDVEKRTPEDVKK